MVNKRMSHNFTLLEVMVSIALFGMLLAFLFTFFKQTLQTKNETALLKEKVRRIELFELRLHSLFDTFTEKGECRVAHLFHGDAVGAALDIRCDHGIQHDPAFSGLLHSMLFKTREDKICLCTWSKNKTPQVDTLLSGVKEISFAFFNGTEWYTVWPKDKKDRAFPYLIRISVLLKGDEEKRQDFIYALPPATEISYSV
jgi:prepilin-type N-terminal cleavage/methylation domain-containing protein